MEGTLDTFGIREQEQEQMIITANKEELLEALNLSESFRKSNILEDGNEASVGLLLDEDNGISVLSIGTGNEYLLSIRLHSASIQDDNNVASDNDSTDQDGNANESRYRKKSGDTRASEENIIGIDGKKLLSVLKTNKKSKSVVMEIKGTELFLDTGNGTRRIAVLSSLRLASQANDQAKGKEVEVIKASEKAFSWLCSEIGTLSDIVVESVSRPGFGCVTLNSDASSDGESQGLHLSANDISDGYYLMMRPGAIHPLASFSALIPKRLAKPFRSLGKAIDDALKKETKKKSKDDSEGDSSKHDGIDISISVIGMMRQEGNPSPYQRILMTDAAFRTAVLPAAHEGIKAKRILIKHPRFSLSIGCNGSDFPFNVVNQFISTISQNMSDYAFIIPYNTLKSSVIDELKNYSSESSLTRIQALSGGTLLFSASETGRGSFNDIKGIKLTEEDLGGYSFQSETADITTTVKTSSLIKLFNAMPKRLNVTLAFKQMPNGVIRTFMSSDDQNALNAGMLAQVSVA